MNGPIDKSELKLVGQNEVSLRGCGLSDLEYLRVWKNENRAAFFHKAHISAEQQHAWFAQYRTRIDDFMFIVLINATRVGCMGLRFCGSEWDVYNVILGNGKFGGCGYMGCALKMMMDFAASRRPGIPIRLKVLKANPAIRWYRANGFAETGEFDDFLIMEYVVPVELRKGGP